MRERVFSTPELTDETEQVLALLDGLREHLAGRLAPPKRWTGSLRRATFARAVQGSNSIEGYNASLDDVGAVVDDEPTLSVSDETRAAIAGYRDAMTFVLQTSGASGRVDEGSLLAMHFMMLGHELGKSPGQWRKGEIFVRREADGEIVYMGPDAERVPALVSAMLASLHAARRDHPLIRAAMAHLNLVMIHPFRDGNGRMGRGLQTLVLARSAVPEPTFSSIEEYLGHNTQRYYDVLAEVGQGSWHPAHSARPWIEFSLTAHFRQAQTHLHRIEEAEDLWRRSVEAAREAGVHERTAAAIFEAALGFRLRNQQYRRIVESAEGEAVSALAATRDLQALTSAGLLEAKGERRGRYYLAAPGTTALRDAVRGGRPPLISADPYELVRSGARPEMGM